MSNIAIEFDNVGKLYRLGLVGTGSLVHDLNRWWQTSVMRREDPYLKIGETNDRSTRGKSDYVWALRDISFKVEQGDVVGIIGKNGAGKSTLLKLLSRVTSPTTGAIRARGRIGSLLEVGTGFHPELTGRENIYMNGSIMGMTKHEIDRKLDEIVDFAGVERYLDTPVKRYSSGMTVRLGFSVAAHLEPEILVVDEVLAVGDAEFQKKAIGKMQDVSRGGGRTVLFVSHNMTAVSNLCKNCVLMEHGRLRSLGKTRAIIDEYLSDDRTIASYDLSDITDYEGNGFLRVGKVEMRSEGCENGYVVNNQPTQLRFEILNPDLQLCGSNLEVAGTFRTATGTGVHYYGTRLKAFIVKIPQKERFFVEVRHACLPFTPGEYNLSVELRVNKDLCFKRQEAVKFVVEPSDFYGSGDRWDVGLVLIDQEWRIIE